MKATRINKLNVESYFSTLIFYKNLDEGIKQNRAWEEQIVGWREQDNEGIIRSNVKKMGAWHSKANMHTREEFSGMTDMLLGVTREVFEHLGFAKNREAVIDNMWANINPPMGYNRSHTHPGCIISGTYYIKVPKDNPGRIIFKDPRVQADMLRPHYEPNQQPDARRWQEVRYAPVAGRVLLFPSWLSHEVEANMSEAEGADAERISVAFNIYQSRPNLQ